MDLEHLRVVRGSSGPTHPAVAGGLHQLAQHLHRAGRLAEAEVSYRESIAVRERPYGVEDEGSSGAQVDLAKLLADRGEYAPPSP